MRTTLFLAEISLSLFMLAEPEVPKLKLPIERTTLRMPREPAPKSDPFSDQFKYPPAPDLVPEPEPRVFDLDRTPSLLVAQKDHDLFVSFIPKSDDQYLDELKSKRLIFYDKKAMRRAYQIWGDSRGRSGIHAAFTNFTGGRDRSGNANVEAPWADPAGLFGNSVDSRLVAGPHAGLRFVHLPPGKAIKWGREIGDKGNKFGYAWWYPEGTVFGEVLLTADTAGFHHTFEVRLREKRHDGAWQVDVYRPFPTEDDYAKAASAHEQSFVSIDDEADDEEAQGLAMPKGRIINLDGDHKKRPFKHTGAIVDVQPMQGMSALRMMDKTVFQSAFGAVWAKTTAGPVYAPTTKLPNQIVPVNYLGGLFKVSTKSCMNCHKDAGEEASFFDDSRDWWGRVRGSDGILSFHIFDDSCISQAGNSLPVKLRPELVNAGLLRHFRDK